MLYRWLRSQGFERLRRMNQLEYWRQKRASPKWLLFFRAIRHLIPPSFTAKINKMVLLSCQSATAFAINLKQTIYDSHTPPVAIFVYVMKRLRNLRNHLWRCLRWASKKKRLACGFTENWLRRNLLTKTVIGCSVWFTRRHLRRIWGQKDALCKILLFLFFFRFLFTFITTGGSSALVSSINEKSLE